MAGLLTHTWLALNIEDFRCNYEWFVVAWLVQLGLLELADVFVLMGYYVIGAV